MLLSDYGISYNSGNLSASAYEDWVLTSALPLFPSTWLGMWMIDQPRVGRTKANCALFGLCCVCIGIGAAVPSVATPMSMVGNGFANVVFLTVYMSVPELYPTKYRAAVLAMCAASAKVAAMIGTYLPNAIGGTRTLLAITVCCAGATLCSVMLVPETLGMPFPSALPKPPCVQAGKAGEELLPASAQ